MRALRGRGTDYCDLHASPPAAGVGLGVDEGMAEALVVDATRLVSVPGIDAATAAAFDRPQSAEVVGRLVLTR